MKGIDAAAALLAQSVQSGESILIVGDFDADGATSSVVMVECLRAMGAYARYLVPNRFEYGYGLTPEIVDVAATMSPAVIVTVDNGISSLEGVQRARELGIKVVITDHHLAGDALPAADAIVNPNQPGCDFPSKNLAGVGVAFYLASVLRQQLREAAWFSAEGIAEPNLADYLDLVALGTVADVVPLDYNNRILVQEGLRRIRAGRSRPGLLAMIEIAGASRRRLVSRDLAFGVAPRLNAAGRLDDISLGIECLLAKDEASAMALARRLDELNQERRAIEKEMKAQAFDAGEDSWVSKRDAVGVSLYHADWHQGVVGIVASRVKDKVHRPVIAFAMGEDGELKGSARSIKGLHIRDALDSIAARHPGLVIKFGGHAMAAGLSLAFENLPRFAAAFDDEAQRWLAPTDLEQVIVSDGSLAAPITVDLVREIQSAAPWGQGFDEPLFDDEFEIVSQRIVGEHHLKLSLARPGEAPIDAIAFNQAQLLEHRFQRMAYRIDINTYRGRSSAQLIVEATMLAAP